VEKGVSPPKVSVLLTAPLRQQLVQRLDRLLLHPRQRTVLDHVVGSLEDVVEFQSEFVVAIASGTRAAR
jgi:hypothetical protein